jgi:Smg protein
MKESVLDVLIFLFENNFDPEAAHPDAVHANYLATETAATAEREALIRHLGEAGFDARHVEAALDWLDGLTADIDRPLPLSAASPLRIFDRRECERLDIECRDFLLYLENVGILDAARRELALDRLMALDCDTIGLEHVKWVVLLVLFSQPEQELPFLRMEGLLFQQRVQGVH